MTLSIRPYDLAPILANIGDYVPFTTDINASSVLTSVVKRGAPFPRANNYPPATKPSVISIWEELVSAYDKPLRELSSSHGNEYAYAAAILLLKKRCKIIGMDQPFENSVLVKSVKKKTSVAYRRNALAIVERAKKAMSVITPIHKSLVAQELILDQSLLTCGPNFHSAYTYKDTYVLGAYFQFSSPIEAGGGTGRVRADPLEKFLPDFLMNKLPAGLARFKKEGDKIVLRVKAKGEDEPMITFTSEGSTILLGIHFSKSEMKVLFEASGQSQQAVDILTQFGRQHNGEILVTINATFDR